MTEFLSSPVRSPSVGGQMSSRVAGSIHDDAVAQRLGFRGGTIAGSIHMDQYPPVLLEAFGQSWFETGSLSLAFKNATTSGEPVIAKVGVPAQAGDVQVAVRTERPSGEVVAEGTASVGRGGDPTHLSAIDLRPSDPSALRILSGVQPGSTKLQHRASIDAATVKERVTSGRLLDPLPWYTESSPWGGSVAHPSALVQLLRNRGGEFGPHIRDAVGLFGAIEIRHHNGPVFLDTEYSVEGEVVAVGASPKTEYVWYDTRALDSTGRVVASMRMQLRWMTASSPLYAS